MGISQGRIPKEYIWAVATPGADSSTVLSGFHGPPQLCSMSTRLSTTAITTATTPCPTAVAKPKREPCVVAAEYVFASSV